MTTNEDWLTTSMKYGRWTKPRLADWLIEHGTVYPNRAGLLKWSKDDLVSSVTDKVLAEQNLREMVESASRQSASWLRAVKNAVND